MHIVTRFPLAALSFLVIGVLVPALHAQVPAANVKVADAVEEFILQFSRGETGFGSRVKLGNPEIFRKELAQLKVTTKSGGQPQHVEYARGGLGGVLPTPQNELRLPFDPLTAKLTYANRLSLYHEAIHQIESLRGVKRDNSVAGAERNTDYMSEVVGALGTWAIYEKQIRNRTPDPDGIDPLERYRDLEAAIRASEKKWGPDRELEVWAGIRAKFEDIEGLYLSGACGPELQILARKARPANPAATGTWELVDVSRADTPADADQLRGRGWFSEPVFGNTTFSARLGGKTGAWGGSAKATWTTPEKYIKPGKKLSITMSASAVNTKENFIEMLVSAVMNGNPLEDSAFRFNAAEWVLPPASPDTIKVVVWCRIRLNPGGYWNIFGQEHVAYTYLYRY